LEVALLRAHAQKRRNAINAAVLQLLRRTFFLCRNNKSLQTKVNLLRENKASFDAEMSLLYSVVARKHAILARYASCAGNFAEITDLVLAKIDTEQNGKMSLSADDFLYHYICEGGVVFLCIAEAAAERAKAFAFLTAVKKRFEELYPAERARTAIPFAMNAEFSPVMAAETRKAASIGQEHDETGEDPDKIERVREEVRQVRDVVVRSIDSIVERGERMELLVDKTEALSAESVAFKRNTRQVQRKMWWRNAKMKVVLASVGVLAVYGVVSASCGGLLWPNCV